ncbi:MAG: alpha/beta hydrolase [Candidatus Magasanikbacteria bacterium]
MQKQIESFDRTKINYDLTKVKNNNKYLVFLHGAGGDLTAWNKERSAFHKKGYSTLAIDLRGHGKSSRPNLSEDYDLENFAKDVFAVLKQEKIVQFVLVGHCFGGMVTMMFHKFFPKLAEAYILIDTTYKAPKKLHWLFHKNLLFVYLLNYILKYKKNKTKNFVHNNFDKYRGTGDWNIKRILSDIAHTSFKSWVFTYQNISKFDAVETMKAIQQRVLIIEGEKDTIFNVLKAKEIHSLIKKSELNIVPNANHIIVLNNPKEIEIEILNFLKSLDF